MSTATLDLELRSAASGGSWHLAVPGASATLCGLPRARTHTAERAPISAARVGQACRRCAAAVQPRCHASRMTQRSTVWCSRPGGHGARGEGYQHTFTRRRPLSEADC